MKKLVIEYCDDCPIISLCDPKLGHNCDYVRRLHEIVSEAPPLTPTQIRKLTVLLSDTELGRTIASRWR